MYKITAKALEENIKLKLKNLQFDPNNDDYYKNTTKSKLRKQRHIEKKKQAEKLKKLLRNRQLNQSKEVINMPKRPPSEMKNFIERTQTPLRTELQKMIQKNRERVRTNSTIFDQKNTPNSKNINKARQTNIRISSSKEDFYLTGSKFEDIKKKKIEKITENYSNEIERLKKDYMEREIEKSITEMTRKKMDKFVRYFEKPGLIKRYRKVRFKTERKRFIDKERGLNFTVRSGSIFNAALPKIQRNVLESKTRGESLDSERENWEKIRISKFEIIDEREEENNKVHKSNFEKKEKSFILNRRSDSVPIVKTNDSIEEETGNELKKFWVNISLKKKDKIRPISRRLDIEGRDDYEGYKSDQRGGDRVSSRRVKKRGKRGQRRVDIQNKISNSQQRRFYKDLEMGTLDDR